MPAKEQYEVVVVGAGIAGASFSHFLSERGIGDVLIVEREATLAVHSTGRSAAVLHELDPNSVVQDLKRLGGNWLRNQPEGFSDHDILTRFGVLTLFRGQVWEAVQHLAEVWKTEGMNVTPLSPDEAHGRVEALDPDAFDGALWMPDAGGLDVHEWLSSYLRHAKGRGVELVTGVEVEGILKEKGRCVGVKTTAGDIRAKWVVDAAGAWAGRVARLAGAVPIELTPMRRCAITYDPPPDLDVSSWPLVASEQDQFYFERETTGLLFCPMDEEPMEPCDARPSDVAIAEGVERLAKVAPRLVPRSIKRKWAGLRTFSPDRVVVIGEDPVVPGFFWLAGQGGSGIETSGALGPIAVDLMLDGTTERYDAKRLVPDRFA